MATHVYIVVFGGKGWSQGAPNANPCKPATDVAGNGNIKPQ